MSSRPPSAVPDRGRPEPHPPTPVVVSTPATPPVEERPPTTQRLGHWWLVAGIAVAGFGFIAADRLRHGVILLAVALWAGAALRAVLPTQRAGGLVVRSRFFDVLVCVALGVAVFSVGLALRRA